MEKGFWFSDGRGPISKCLGPLKAASPSAMDKLPVGFSVRVLIPSMDEKALVTLLDRADEYIRANESLISALRTGYFALAQTRYSKDYRQVRAFQGLSYTSEFAKVPLVELTAVHVQVPFVLDGASPLRVIREEDGVGATSLSLACRNRTVDEKEFNKVQPSSETSIS